MARVTEPGADGRLAQADAAPEGVDSTAQPLSPERLRRASSAQRGYYRWMRLSRLALASFMIIAGVTLVWLVPWLRVGLNAKDYTPQMTFTVYLLGGVTILAVLAFAFREFAQRDRETLLVWATVYDEGTGLHNRAYLFDRLNLECERVATTHDTFSIIVLQLRTVGEQPKSGHRVGTSNDLLQQIAERIDTYIRRRDLVALLSGSELAVLAMSVSGKERSELQERLAQAASQVLPHTAGRPADVIVRAGAATYELDGTLPAALIQAARTAAGFGTVPHLAKTA